MNLDVDFLISFFEKNSSPKKNKSEMGEQDVASAPTTGGKAVPKWADVHGGPTRGKANRLGRSGEKWETGMNRGVANQIW